MTTHEKINIDDLFGADDADADADNAVGPEVVRRPTRSQPSPATTAPTMDTCADDDLSALIAGMGDGWVEEAEHHLGDGDEHEPFEDEDPLDGVAGAGTAVDTPENDDPGDADDNDDIPGDLDDTPGDLEDTSDGCLCIDGNDILREEFNDYLTVAAGANEVPATTTTALGNDAGGDQEDAEAQRATLEGLRDVLVELTAHLTRTIASVDAALAGIDAMAND